VTRHGVFVALARIAVGSWDPPRRSRQAPCRAVPSTKALHEGALVGSGLLRKAVQSLLHAPRDDQGLADSPLVDRLTPRELQVLGFVVQGYGNKGIGTELGLTEVTIKKHVQSIMGKLGASGRTHAAILRVRLGLAE
jgi:DNA-binding NarL/FixJ family response regulator